MISLLFLNSPWTFFLIVSSSRTVISTFPESSEAASFSIPLLLYVSTTGIADVSSALSWKWVFAGFVADGNAGECVDLESAFASGSVIVPPSSSTEKKKLFYLSHS